MDKKWIGVPLMIVGVLLLVSGTGIVDISFPAQVASVTSQGRGGASMEVQELTSPLALARGADYQWKVTVKNTGDVDWSNGHITLRLGKPGYSTYQQTATEAGVDYCSSSGCGIGVRNEPTSLEYIVSDWNLEVSADGSNWVSPPECSSNDRVCKVRKHNGQISDYVWNLNAGDTDTIYFRMEIPEDAQESTYTLVSNLVAHVGSTSYGVAGNTKGVEVGGMPNGDLVISFIGVLALLGALAVMFL